MYKDRMFENNNEYLSFIARLGLPSDAGNVYQVIQTGKPFYSDFYANKQFQYSDSSWAVYPDSGNGLGIQAAINACKGGRNDYVLIGTGTYALTAAINLAGKSSVHLLGVNGGGAHVGTPGPAILHQYGNFSTVKMNAYCELAGVTIENMPGYFAIEVPANLAWVNIHHNYIRWQMSAGIDAINVAYNGATGGSISHNKINNWSGTAGRGAIYVEDYRTTDLVISHNEIICRGDGAVMDVGICHLGMGGMVRDNYISESGGTTSTYGGTITVGIQVGVSACAISNRIAVTSTQGLAGGTADVTFVDNKDALNGGAVEIVT